MSILRENKVELSIEAKELVLETVKPMVKDLVILLGLAEGRTISGYKKNLGEESFGLYENVDLENATGKILEIVLEDVIKAKFYENFDIVMCNFPICCKDDFVGLSEIAHHVLEELKYSTNYVHFIDVLNKCDKDDIDDYKKSVLNTTIKYMERYIKTTQTDIDFIMNGTDIFKDLDEALGL